MVQRDKRENRAFPAIFSRLGPEEQIKLFNTGAVRKLAEEEPLFKKGEVDKNIYWVLNGTLRVLTRGSDPPGRKFETGELVGETTLLSPAGRKFSVIAIEASAVFRLSPEALNALDPETRGQIFKIIHDTVCGRLGSLEEQTETARRREAALSKYVEKSRRPLERYERSEVITTIVDNMPILPLHITQLIGLLSSDTPSAREVAALAKQDPSLVVDILKTINSPRFHLPRQITDISYAITYLGFNEVYHIAVSRGLMKLMPDSDEFQEVYRHSLFLSHVGAELSHAYDKDLAPLLGTTGLLHDVGKTVALLLRKQYPKWSLFIAMLDSSKLGSMLLKHWNIPDRICETIEYQTYPAFCHPLEIPSAQKIDIALLYVAHVACEHMSKGETKAIDHPYLDDYLRLFEFSHGGIEHIVKECILPGLAAKAQWLPESVRRFIPATRAGLRRQ